MRHLAVAVSVAALIPGSALGQCTEEPLVYALRDWQDTARKLSSNQLDTWTTGADWKDTEDCAKVRNAAKQVIRFGNPDLDLEDVNERWPVIEWICFAVPKFAGVSLDGGTTATATATGIMSPWSTRRTTFRTRSSSRTT